MRLPPPAFQPTGSGCWRILNQEASGQDFFGYIRGDGIQNPDKAFRVDVTLFRRDKMRSVNICGESVGCCWDPDGDEEKLSFAGHSPFFARNNAGNTARSMVHDRGFESDCFFPEITLVAKLPAPRSKEEPRWLSNCRQAVLCGEDYHPDREDCGALKKIPI